MKNFIVGGFVIIVVLLFVANHETLMAMDIDTEQLTNTEYVAQMYEDIYPNMSMSSGIAEVDMWIERIENIQQGIEQTYSIIVDNAKETISTEWTSWNWVTSSTLSLTNWFTTLFT